MSLPTLGAGPSGGGGGAAPFVGFLDGVSNVEHVYLLFRGLSAYTGDLVRLRAEPSDREEDFAWDSISQEFLDTAAVDTWLAGEDPYIVTVYDQAAAGDNITQETASGQLALTLADATANNKPTMEGSRGDYLKGTFTNGGLLSQPNTIYSAAKKTSGNAAEVLYDGEVSTARHALFSSGSDLWVIQGDTQLAGGADDNNWNISTAVFNGASSQFWFNGISKASGDAGNHNLGGLCLGVAYTLNNLLNWLGPLVGAIIIDGNSSNDDKNTIGQKFDDVYDITYTDIV